MERPKAAETSHREAFKIEKHPGALAYRIRYRSVPRGWLEVADQVDDSWTDRANRLNNARNLAAHRHDEKRIAAKLGISGENKHERVRAERLQLVDSLLGVSVPSEQAQPGAIGE
jgi:hypothetical protein